MKKTITSILSCSLLLLSSTAIALSDNQQQHSFSQPEIQIQNEVYQLADELMEVDSITTSCSSCISLLQVIKKMSYFSEGFLINTLTKVCKRTKRVDDEVVSIYQNLSVCTIDK